MSRGWSRAHPLHAVKGVKTRAASSAFQVQPVRSFEVDTPHPGKWRHAGTDHSHVCAAPFTRSDWRHRCTFHCSNLGCRGNIRLDDFATIEAAERFPDSYPTHASVSLLRNGGGRISFFVAASQLVEAMQKHPNVTIGRSGQIQIRAKTVTISADSMHQYENSGHAKPRKKRVG